MQGNLQNNVAFYSGKYMPVNQPMASMINGYSVVPQIPDYRNSINSSSFSWNNNPGLGVRGIVHNGLQSYVMPPSHNGATVTNQSFHERMLSRIQYMQSGVKYQANNYVDDTHQVYPHSSINVTRPAMNSQQHAMLRYSYMPRIINTQSLNPVELGKAEFEKAMLMKGPKGHCFSKEQVEISTMKYSSSLYHNLNSESQKYTGSLEVNSDPIPETKSNARSQSVVPIIVDVRSLAPDPETKVSLCSNSEDFVKPMPVSSKQVVMELPKGNSQKQPDISNVMPKVESVWSISPDNTSVSLCQVNSAYNGNELISSFPVRHQKNTVQHTESHPNSGITISTNLNPIVSSTTSDKSDVLGNIEIKQNDEKKIDLLHANNLHVKSEQLHWPTHEYSAKYPYKQQTFNEILQFLKYGELVQNNQTPCNAPYIELVPKSADEHSNMHPNIHSSCNIVRSESVQKSAEEHGVKVPISQTSCTIPCGNPEQVSQTSCTIPCGNQQKPLIVHHTYPAIQKSCNESNSDEMAQKSADKPHLKYMLSQPSQIEPVPKPADGHNAIYPTIQTSYNAGCSASKQESENEHHAKYSNIHISSNIRCSELVQKLTVYPNTQISCNLSRTEQGQRLSGKHNAQKSTDEHFAEQPIKQMYADEHCEKYSNSQKLCNVTLSEPVVKTADKHCTKYPNSQSVCSVPHRELVQVSVDECYSIYAYNKTPNNQPVQKSADDHSIYPKKTSCNEPIQKSADDHSVYLNKTSCNEPVQKSADDHSIYPNNKTLCNDPVQKSADDHSVYPNKTSCNEPVQKSADDHSIYPNNKASCNEPVQKSADDHSIYPNNKTSINEPVQKSADDRSIYPNKKSSCNKPVQKSADELYKKYPQLLEEPNANTIFRWDKMQKPPATQLANNLTNDLKRPVQNLSDASHASNLDTSINSCGPMKNLLNMSPEKDGHNDDAKCNKPKNYSNLCTNGRLMSSLDILYKKQSMNSSVFRDGDGKPSQCSSDLIHADNSNTELSSEDCSLMKNPSDLPQVTDLHTKKGKSMVMNDSAVASLALCKEKLDSHLSTPSTQSTNHKYSVTNGKITKVADTFSSQNKIIECSAEGNADTVNSRESVLSTTPLSGHGKTITDIKKEPQSDDEYIAPQLTAVPQSTNAQSGCNFNQMFKENKLKIKILSDEDKQLPADYSIINIMTCRNKTSSRPILSYSEGESVTQLMHNMLATNMSADVRDLFRHNPRQSKGKELFAPNLKVIAEKLPSDFDYQVSFPTENLKNNGEHSSRKDLSASNLKVIIEKLPECRVELLNIRHGNVRKRKRDEQEINFHLKEEISKMKMCKKNLDSINTTLPGELVPGEHKRCNTDMKVPEMKYKTKKRYHSSDAYFRNTGQQQDTLTKDVNSKLYKKSCLKNVHKSIKCEYKTKKLRLSPGASFIRSREHQQKTIKRDINSKLQKKSHLKEIHENQLMKSEGVPGCQLNQKNVPMHAQYLPTHLADAALTSSEKSVSPKTPQQMCITSTRMPKPYTTKNTNREHTVEVTNYDPKESKYIHHFKNLIKKYNSEKKQDQESTSCVRQKAEMSEGVKGALENSKMKTITKTTDALQPPCVQDHIPGKRKYEMETPAQGLVKHSFNGVQIPCITRYDKAFLPLNLIHRWFFVREPLIKFRRVLQELHIHKREMSVDEQKMLEPILKKYSIKSSKLIMFSELVHNFDKLCYKLNY
ncbi:uncharacterized protein LOC117122532 isoform X2 [Anneissia japonica]|uniref:uncharacterized protein LOC117122532 isoform X2 n=1 Tax=Anneissia japonica TaxID=1529436 RepID=UPI00142554DB|nr:uncharacterized protein LOC117122532 isoform X2 [Anneissia japonica]